ncbi:MAG: hypothetical protein KAS73_09740 [Candidatus Sabulitectum sp.]|nr:hypothetical protein [Candidatus Sabulitectum sp.]
MLRKARLFSILLVIDTTGYYLSHGGFAIKGQQKENMIINFECKKCKNEFDCEMGTIGIYEKTWRPDFEKPIICPECGERTMDEVFLTEIGQGQMTASTMFLQTIKSL